MKQLSMWKKYRPSKDRQGARATAATIPARGPVQVPQQPAKAATVARPEPKPDLRMDGSRYFVEKYAPSPTTTDSLHDRVRGCVLWGAYGDSCGMPFEGQAPFVIWQHNARQWVQGLTKPKNNFGSYLGSGGWTDDTQLSLALLQSMIDCDGDVDLEDIGYHHVRMLEAGPRGWGGSTRESVMRLKSGSDWKKSGKPGGSGNGIVMKIAPLGLRYGILHSEELRSGQFRYKQLVSDARDIAIMTHRDSRAIISGAVQAILVAWIMNDIDPLSRWDDLMTLIRKLETIFPDEGDTLSERFEHIPPNLGRGPEYFAHLFRTGCYLVESYPFSVATYLEHRKDVVGGVLAAVNAGGDCDSTAAMVGNLCGADAGLGTEDRTLDLEQHDLILGVADEFYAKMRYARGCNT